MLSSFTSKFKLFSRLGSEMLRQFFFKSPREKKFLAIELTAGSVKIVKMNAAGERLSLIGIRSEFFQRLDDPNEEENVWKKHLTKLLEGEDLESQTLLLSVNSPHACFGKFVLPKIPHKELTEILRWKIQDILPFPPEEAVLDQKLFEIPGTQNEPRFTALVVASPASFTNRFHRILLEGGYPSFTPAYSAFTVSSFSRSFDMPERHLIALVDIGYSVTEINLYEAGRLCFIRKIAFGTQLISQVLTQSLAGEGGKIALDSVEAEKAMRFENLLNAQNHTMVAGKIEAAKLFQLVRPEFEKLIGELQRSFDYYTQEQGEGIERVFIAGGGSQLVGISNFLEKELDIPVKNLKLDDEIIIKCAVPKEGLAPYYRLISLIADRKDMDASFISDLEKTASKVIKVLSYPKVALAAGVILLVLWGGLFLREQSIRQKTEELKSQVTNLEPGFEFSKKIRSIENQIEQSNKITARLQGREPAWKEVFFELSQFTPRNIILGGATYSAQALILRGTIFSGADRESILSSYLVSLEGPVFRKVTLVSVEQKPEQKFANFTIRCELN